MPNPGTPKTVVDGWQLLSVIADHGRRWPAVLPGHSVDALAEALGRQIVAGNLADGATLTEQGREALRRHSLSEQRR